MNPTLRLSLLVVLLCGLVYANALVNEFVYDDWDLIVNNHWLKDGPFLDAFRIGYWESSRGGSFYYRPVVSISYWVDHLIWKERPAGYRLSNIGLHAAASILVLLLAARGLSSLPAAAAAAALFAVHPIHSSRTVTAAAALESAAIPITG